MQVSHRGPAGKQKKTAYADFTSDRMTFPGFTDPPKAIPLLVAMILKLVRGL
jgi:hypothetical protein